MAIIYNLERIQIPYEPWQDIKTSINIILKEQVRLKRQNFAFANTNIKILG
jgi:hypothetical protein